MTKQPWISVSHILLPKYFNHSHPISHSKPLLCFSSITPFFQSYFLSSKNTLFREKACLIWPLAYFFSNVFLARNFNFILLKHQKTNTRAFRSKGAICPNIPSFNLCFLFIFLAQIFITLHFYTCLLSQPRFYYLVLFLRCQVPIEHMQSFCTNPEAI